MSWWDGGPGNTGLIPETPTLTPMSVVCFTLFFWFGPTTPVLELLDLVLYAFRQKAAVTSMKRLEAMQGQLNGVPPSRPAHFFWVPANVES